MNLFLRILVVLFFISAVGNTNAQTLQFAENKGQWNSKVKFKTDLGGGALFLQANGYRVLLNNKDDLAKIAERLHAHKKISGSAVSAAEVLEQIKEKLILRAQAYEVSFVGAKQGGDVVPDKPVSVANNYFVGSDEKQWATDCKIYQGVTFKEIYPGIDVRYYTNDGKLKYDLIVHPGADVSRIALKFEGINKLSVKKDNLAVATEMGEVTELKPYTYQFDNVNGKQEIAAKYVVKDNIVRFKVDRYNTKATLVIDPTLIFSSFTGSLSDNWGYTATYDGSGNFYAGGISFGSGYPVTLGVFQSQFAGGVPNNNGLQGYDVAITKFSPDGSRRLYATYLGGTGNEQPHSMIVDNDGNLVVAGRTSSTDFPITAATYGAGGGFDIFISKISSDGTKLIASRKFGGSNDDGVNIADKEVPVSAGNISIRRNYGDDARSEVIVDNSNNIYLASCSQSGSFPVTANAFQRTYGGGTQDGVLMKVSPGLSTVYFSSFLGGSKDDAAFVLSLNPANNNIYVAGGTTSSNLSGTGGNNGPVLFSIFKGGETDGFISIISNDGSQLIKTCYVGGTGSDIVYGVQFDKYNFPYITGTTSVALPVVNAAFTKQSGGKQFITKLQPDLSGIVYSTNFGKGQGEPDLSITAFLVDRCENVYVAGWGGGIDGGYPNASTTGLTVTPDAIRNFTDGNDFYFFVLEKNALSQLYGSFFGNDDRGLTQLIGDHVDGGTSRFDKEGVIYEAICANCEQLGIFPTTPGVVGPSNPSGTGARCNEAALKIAFELAGVGSGVRSAIDGVPRDTSGCLPLTVDFTDTIATGKSFLWNFGDGSPQLRTTTPSTSHTYTVIGNFRVQLISIDSLTCNISDTSYVNIRVRDDKAYVNFLSTKLPPCESLQYRFDNTSTGPVSKPFNGASFLWDFGDGTTQIAGTNSVTHNFPAPGTYNVILNLVDTSYCNSPDADTLQLRIAPNVDALFETPPFGCAPYDAVFNNTSLAGQQFLWDFGDGSPISTEISPTHTYTIPGTYTIRMTAIDSSTCNLIDSTQQTITVSEKPSAEFAASPQPPKENTAITFTNLSFGGTRFLWTFGDGDSLATTKVDTLVQHIYNKTNTYNACVYAYNDFGCFDSACHDVAALIFPLVDVPNAFTPNGDGVNDFVTPRGFGIDKLDFRVYNRWGALIFHSSAYGQGWDGRYKGALQAQDVYVYVLDITFTDGTKTRKTGDITLLQ